MPFNGNGVFNLDITFVPNTLATAEDQNSQDSDIADGLTNCVTRDGQSPATADISMGGFQINNLRAPTLPTDAANLQTVTEALAGTTNSVRAAAAGGMDIATITDYLIYWNYAYSGTKVQVLPAASAFREGQFLVIKDKYGDAATNNIRISPQSGTIDLVLNFFINIGKQSVTLMADTVSNDWVIV